MSTCPTPQGGRQKKRAQPELRPAAPEPGEASPVPPGMVRLLSGQLVTEEDANELLPRARPPGERAPAREVFADAEPAYHRTPASACCAHTFDPEALHDELDSLRAQVALEREARIRAEAFAEGERAAYERVLATVLATRPVVLPAQPKHATAPVTQASVTRNAEPSVTQEEVEEGEDERRRRLAAARQRDWRLRQRHRNAESSVTQEKKNPSPPSPSAGEGRVPEAGVTLPSVTPQRDAPSAGLREHRKPDTLPADVQALREAWNALAAPHGFARWAERTSRQLLADALAALERRPLAEWREVFSLVPRSPVCRGELASRQRASLVYVLRGETRAGYEPAEQLLSGAWSVDPLPSAPMDAPPVPGTLPSSPAAHAWRQVLDMMDADGRYHVVGQLRLRVQPEALEGGYLVLACTDSYARTWLEEEGVLDLVRQTLRALDYEGVRLRDGDAPLVQPLPTPGPARSPPPEALPFELGPEDNAPAESLQEGVDRLFREAKGAAYTWRSGRDDTASRALLSLAGEGGTPEVLRRWRHGLAATFRQRCDTLADLVHRWEANAQAEARAGAGPPGRRSSAAPAPASQPEEYPQPF